MKPAASLRRIKDEVAAKLSPRKQTPRKRLPLMTMQFLAEQNAQGNAILNNPTLRDAISIHREKEVPPVATLTLQVNSIEMKDKFDTEHMYVVVAAGGHAAVFPYKDAGRITTFTVGDDFSITVNVLAVLASDAQSKDLKEMESELVGKLEFQHLKARPFPLTSASYELKNAAGPSVGTVVVAYQISMNPPPAPPKSEPTFYYQGSLNHQQGTSSWSVVLATLNGTTLSFEGADAASAIDLKGATAVSTVSQEDGVAKKPFGIAVSFEGDKDDVILYGVNSMTRQEWMAQIRKALKL